MNYKLVEIKPSKELKNDVMAVVNGLYGMNAPHSMGYLFTSDDNKEVYRGMFCDFKREIGCGEWDYYYEYFSKKFYRIDIMEQ